MSKIGQQLIEIPDGVSIEIEEQKITVKGSKGTLEKTLPHGFELNIEEKQAKLIPPKTLNKQNKALWGTWRMLIHNMIHGVHEGFKKELEYKGVGYKAVVDGKKLTLSLGFSHPIIIEAPENIDFKAEKNTIIVEGIDKEIVGQIAAKIRKLRPPEPYKGAGIKYKDEVIRRKEGKRAVGSGF